MTDQQQGLYMAYHSSVDIESRYGIARTIVEENKKNPIVYYWENDSLVSLKDELWMPINVPYFSSYFEVSNFCRLKRLFRNGNPKRWEETILLPTEKSNGRIKYTGYVGNKKMAIYCHRAVGLTFIPNPKNKLTINHIDGDPKNCHFLNLEWATFSENELHSYNVLGKKSAKPTGANSPNWIGKVSQLSLNGEKIRTFDCVKDVKKEGFYPSHVYRVINGERKTTGGFAWQLEK